nr:phage head closure protein [Prosthecomicrobium pneumaticum]
MRHRVTVLRPVSMPDGAGGVAVSFTPLAAVWAAIEPVKAAEDAGPDRPATRLTHRVTIRYRADVEGGMALSHRGRTLRITAMRDPDEGRRLLTLDCVEERR